MAASSIQINDKEFVDVKSAVSRSGYSRDHIARLAKTQKISGVQLHQRWYINVASLQGYVELQKIETALKQRQLSTARQVELALHAALTAEDDSTQKTLLRTSNRVAAGISFVFLIVGSYVGADVLTELVVSDAAPALVVSSLDQPDQINSQSYTTADVLQPVFSDRSEIVVATDRTIPRPMVTSRWYFITP